MNSLAGLDAPLACCAPSRKTPSSHNSVRTGHTMAGRRVRTRTGRRESTRLVNKNLSNFWKILRPQGYSIFNLFRPEDLAVALRRLRPGKCRSLDSIFPEFILHARSAFKSWFCDFLTSCMRQLKIPKIMREH